MELHSYLNTLGIVASLLGVFWLAAVKITRLEVKVDTMWLFLIKRSIVEGVETGFLRSNSPVRLEPHSVKPFIHLAGELKAFASKQRSLKEPELMLAIEREFGSRLIHEVCIPNRLTFGLCLLLATAVAKDMDHTLTELLDEYKIPSYGDQRKSKNWTKKK
jgi:hypothetical protein